MAKKVTRGGKTVRIGDRIGLLNETEIGIGRDKVLADSLNRPASRLAYPPTLDKLRKHRADRVREDHARRCRMLCHETADTGQRTARADPHHNGIDVALHLAKNFRTGCGLVGLRVSGIGELIDEERTRRTRGDVLGEVLIIVGVAPANVRAR